MGGSELCELPSDLAHGRTRFHAWRGQRKLGARIPQPLWALAVQLATVHGVSRTATVLGVDYYGLQKRMSMVPVEPQANGPAFVEMPAPLMVGKQCQLEFENGSGATMRVQLVGYDAADVEALSRSFWNTR
jgi:hypothetical protein